MENSFKLRVDRVFGSLSTSTSAPQNLRSLWSLTDDEIERKEWNRDRDEPEAEAEAEPNAFFANLRVKKTDSGFGEELEKDILDLDDGLDEEEETEARESRDSSSRSAASARGDDYNDEEWEIKSNIGLDCTLDNEEEEDQYDKVAIGKEKPGDRLYMKEINDYGIDVDSFNELPNSFTEVTRDPRANHIAAKIRLKEDEEAANKIDSLRVSQKETPSDTSSPVNTTEDGKLKPILKRGDTKDSRPHKRVRFDSACKHNSEKDDFDGKTEEEEEAIVSKEAFPLPPGYPSGIPDYMRNPSKYTRYNFDSDDIDDKSNRQAYMDFLNMINKSKATEPVPEDDASDLPKTVIFIPRRKTGDATMTENDAKLKQNQDNTSKNSVSSRGLPFVIAARDAEDEVCAMEEDDPETAANKTSGSQRSCRQYRMKEHSDLE